MLPDRVAAYRPGSAERLEASVVIHPSRLEVRLSGDRWDLSLSDVSVEARDNDPPLLVVSAPDGRTVVLPRSCLEELRAAGGPEFAARLRSVAAVSAKRTTALTGLVVVVLLGLVGVVVGGYFAIPALARVTVHQMPTTVDRQVGDGAWQGMDERRLVITSPGVVSPVQLIVDRLKPQLDPTGQFDFRVAVVEREELNAFALPGGQMVVLTGLLRKTTRAEQAAGVIAHEMAHVVKRHGMEAMAKQLGVVAAVAMVFGDFTGLSGMAAMGTIEALSAGYSREAEREADAEGCKAMIAARIDPKGMPELFGILASEPGTELTGTLGWLSSHPGHQERIDALNQQIEAAGDLPHLPLPIDWQAMQAELPSRDKPKPGSITTAPAVPGPEAPEGKDGK